MKEVIGIWRYLKTVLTNSKVIRSIWTFFKNTASRTVSRHIVDGHWRKHPDPDIDQKIWVSSYKRGG